MLAALDAVERITGAPQVNIGGTLPRRDDGDCSRLRISPRTGKAIASRSRLTNTLVDLAEPGDLGMFTDEDTIARLEKKMNERGYLESTEMAGTFNWMRANDLIWSYVVNNWYMGKKPPAFDILAWNGDSTRMPAAMHSQYLRACYLHNLLVVPNAFVLDGVPIDLGKIQQRRCTCSARRPITSRRGARRTGQRSTWAAR